MRFFNTTLYIIALNKIVGELSEQDKGKLSTVNKAWSKGSSSNELSLYAEVEVAIIGSMFNINAAPPVVSNTRRRVKRLVLAHFSMDQQLFATDLS